MHRSEWWKRDQISVQPSLCKGLIEVQAARTGVSKLLTHILPISGGGNHTPGLYLPGATKLFNKDPPLILAKFNCHFHVLPDVQYHWAELLDFGASELRCHIRLILDALSLQNPAE